MVIMEFKKKHRDLPGSQIYFVTGARGKKKNRNKHPQIWTRFKEEVFTMVVVKHWG